MKNSIILIFIILLITVTGCYNPDENSDTAVINFNLGTGSNSSARFSKAPSASDISSFVLTITGEGMSTISVTYGADTTQISLEVPAGNAREIELVCNIDPSSPGAVLSYMGNTTENLTAGETVNVALSMMLYETKIIFPNPNDFQGASYRRIIQLDSINDSSPIELRIADVNPSLNPISTFMPWDIDFDFNGRIYIANNDSSTDNDCVIRIDNFTTPNPEKVAENGSLYGILSVAVDRINNLLYYSSTNNTLQVTDLSSASFPDIGTSIDISSISLNPYIIAIAVDNDGMLYLADAGDIGVDTDDQFVKFNPYTSNVIRTYTNNINFRQQSGGSTNNLSDIMFFDNIVYLLNFNGSNNYLVMQFNTDLQLTSGYGVKVSSYVTDTTQNHYYGPHFFAARRRDKYYIMDEMGSNSYGTEFNKLVSMDDISGTNWDFNDSFDFFYDC